MEYWSKTPVHFTKEGFMSSVGFTTFSPIGSTGTTPLPSLPVGTTHGIYGPQPIIRRPSVGAAETAKPASLSVVPAARPAAPLATAAPTKTAPGGGHSGGGSAPIAAATATTVDELIAGYSTTVGGKQYAASVDESGGEYTASIATIPRTSASGSTEQTAENNLNAHIDELA
jgi:hypothetical protein